MRFLVDVNLTPEWVTCLQVAGYGAVHWCQIGLVNALDEELIDHAAENNFIVFTQDLDFGSILARSGAAGPSVLQLREQEVDPQGIGDAVVAAIQQCSE